MNNPIYSLILLGLAYAVTGAVAGRIDFFKRQGLGATDRHELCDGLRGLLALGVFFHHVVVSYQYWTGTGWRDPEAFFFAQLGPIPVQLFFALSGFLFWQKLGQSKGPINWMRFYGDRLRRLLPAYAASMAYLILLVFVWSNFRLYEPPLEFLHNLLPWFSFGVYGAEFSNLNLMIHTSKLNAGVFWSLRYEWFFYFSLFFLPWFTRGRRLFPLLVGALIVYVLIRRFVFTDILHSPRFVSSILGFLTYFVSAFGIGMVAAHLKRIFPRTSWGANPVFGTLGTICFLVALLVPMKMSLYLALPISRLLLSLFFFSVIFGNDLFGLLKTQGAKTLGLVSYSLYVWHGLVLYTFCNRVTRFVPLNQFSEAVLWSGALVAMIFVLLVSLLSYRFVEFPFLRKPPKRELLSDEGLESTRLGRSRLKITSA